MNKNNPARPTVRIDREFDKKLKIAMIQKGISFQELATKLLENWYEENKGGVE